MRATVIIPFHRHLAHLRESLPAARRALPDAEILVAADGAVEDCREVAAASGANVVTIAGPQGPATARNRAAHQARGDILVFVDADVVASPDALRGMCERLEREPGLAGVFGAYDLTPAEANFMSQYKNLSHAYVHETGNPNARTFWAGLGALRADAFRAVGGFDERFRRPSVEDIELGYRLTGAGHVLRLDPAFRAQHLKRWTVRNSVSTEIFARGVPWTQLVHRFGALSNDLNLTVRLRMAVILSYCAVLFGLAAVATPWALTVSAACVVLLVILNRDYYRWFIHRRGVLFAVGVVPAHLLHHLCNGVSFALGSVLHSASLLGIRLPGALPPSDWPAGRQTHQDPAPKVMAR